MQIIHKLQVNRKLECQERMENDTNVWLRRVIIC